MTTEDALKYLQTRQLTDYREDWPNKKKGCLFLWQLESSGTVCNRYALVIADFSWRKGANWEDYPKLLPLEKEILQRNNSAVEWSYYSSRILDFNAILIAACIHQTSLSKEDVLSLWKEYTSRMSDNSYNWPRMHDVMTFFRFKQNLSEENQQILNMVFPNKEKQVSSQEYICSLWEPALQNWIDTIKHEMTPEKQLFATHMEFQIDEQREIEVPVRVYDRGEAEYERDGAVIHLDTFNYWEDGTEIYVNSEAIIGKTNIDELCVQYDAPEYIERKGYNFDYDENTEELIATEFEDEYSCLYDNYTEDSLSYGLTTFIIQYSATGMLLNSCEAPKIHDALSKLMKYTNNLSLDNIVISIPKDVYDMYFKRFCKKYGEDHKDDCEYICLTEKEQIVVCAEEAKKKERKNIDKSTGIHDYLTLEQSTRLKNYVERYLRYLDGVIANMNSISGQISYNYFDHAVHEDHRKSINITVKND